jgi:hypothetical protein
MEVAKSFTNVNRVRMYNGKCGVVNLGVSTDAVSFLTS